MRRLLLALAICFFSAAVAYAQQGCCSHHGGVCDCSCCDGTPLSDICRPYFPCGGGGGGGGGSTAPGHLSGYAPSSTQCILTWIDNSIGEDYFQIEAKDNNLGYYDVAGTVPANTTTATIGDLTPATTYSFRVRARGGSGDTAYSNETTVTTLTDPSTACLAPAVCFGNSRFKVEAQWKTVDGKSGAGTVVRMSDDSGYLWFFAASNVEVVFKILNACGLNNAYWFYAGGLTNVQVTITVTDLLTGKSKVYTNPQGKAFQPIQDISAFATCP